MAIKHTLEAENNTLIQTLFNLHWKNVHLVHSLLQLKLSRGRHRVDIFIVPVVVGVRVGAVHLMGNSKHTFRSLHVFTEERPAKRTICSYWRDKTLFMLANLSVKACESQRGRESGSAKGASQHFSKLYKHNHRTVKSQQMYCTHVTKLALHWYRTDHKNVCCAFSLKRLSADTLTHVGSCLFSCLTHENMALG